MKIVRCVTSYHNWRACAHDDKAPFSIIFSHRSSSERGWWKKKDSLSRVSAAAGSVINFKYSPAELLLFFHSFTFDTAFYRSSAPLLHPALAEPITTIIKRMISCSRLEESSPRGRGRGGGRINKRKKAAGRGGVGGMKNRKPIDFLIELCLSRRRRRRRRCWPKDLIRIRERTEMSKKEAPPAYTYIASCCSLFENRSKYQRRGGGGGGGKKYRQRQAASTRFACKTSR